METSMRVIDGRCKSWKSKDKLERHGIAENCKRAISSVE